ncbi:hypothetical protein EDD18DRAFT_339767 [Armillaria luteobubalina]|uniref:Secreted protein n=1 Tax=Armillaria luteobubalina TaxID=153913 RepID=A0AA39QPI3_9AGAR|nr:hypothetical protein EDD18DRAFT_339767 [Armillaria luteobubalina]
MPNRNVILLHLFIAAPSLQLFDSTCEDRSDPSPCCLADDRAAETNTQDGWTQIDYIQYDGANGIRRKTFPVVIEVRMQRVMYRVGAKQTLSRMTV